MFRNKPYLLFLCLFSCTDNAVEVLRQADYFPLSIGHYWIYEIDEIRYSEFNPPEVFHYELKSEIVDSFINGEGIETYVIYRSTRNSSLESWAYKQTWTAYSTEQYSVENEANVSFIKLLFPLVKNSAWNGNKLNSLGEEIYQVENIVDEYFVDGNTTFAKSVVINQNDENSLLFSDERSEVYSFKIGLVYKESRVVEFNVINGVPTSQIIGGYYWKQVLKEYVQS